MRSHANADHLADHLSGHQLNLHPQALNLKASNVYRPVSAELRSCRVIRSKMAGAKNLLSQLRTGTHGGAISARSFVGPKGKGLRLAPRYLARLPGSRSDHVWPVLGKGRLGREIEINLVWRLRTHVCAGGASAGSPNQEIDHRAKGHRCMGVRRATAAQGRPQR